MSELKGWKAGQLGRILQVVVRAFVEQQHVAGLIESCQTDSANQVPRGEINARLCAARDGSSALNGIEDGIDAFSDRRDSARKRCPRSEHLQNRGSDLRNVGQRKIAAAQKVDVLPAVNTHASRHRPIDRSAGENRLGKGWLSAHGMSAISGGMSPRRRTST